MTRALVAVIACTLAAGCLSHMPLDKRTHLQIRWSANWEAAAAEAQRTHKPILACLVAGEIDGLC
jgi:hypothetical protein